MSSVYNEAVQTDISCLRGPFESRAAKPRGTSGICLLASVFLASRKERSARREHLLKISFRGAVSSSFPEKNTPHLPLPQGRQRGGLRPRAVPEGLTARFPSEMTRLTPTHVFPQAACVARRGRTRTPFRGPLVLSKMARRLLVVFAWDPDAARVVVWRWARGWARLSGRCPPVASGGPCEAAAAGAGSEA